MRDLALGWRTRAARVAGAGLLSVLAAACGSPPVASEPRRTELTIGYGDTRPRASIDRGIRTIATTLTSERLLVLGRNGRPASLSPI